MQKFSPIIWLLAVFVALGWSYALLTPPFEASDELWHYPMIRHLADGNPLPVQVYDPALAGPWHQEASQPPLYYYVGALLTFWIDTSDMEEVRWLNPQVSNGVVTADGNINLAIHPDHFNPWQGTLLAIRLVRLFSVLLGACTVYLTYLIALEVTPTRPDLALGAAAFNAFTPMFLFISGAVNNDNLALPLASLGVLLLIRLVTRPPVNSSLFFYSALSTQNSLLIGVVMGAAILTKQGTFALLGLAWGACFIFQHQRLSQQNSPSFKLLIQAFLWAQGQFALMLLPVLLIAGWWYWRNIQLYGDLLGWSAFIAVLGQRETPAPLAQLWDERHGFMMAYWGLFGGVNVPMWPWIYTVLNGLVVLAIPGFVLYSAKTIQATLKSNHKTPILSSPFFFHISTFLFHISQHFALVVCLIFSAGVVYGLIQWATTTWSSQGRLVFTAISTLNVLWTLGLVGWLPEKIARPVLGLLGGFMLVIATITPWVFIRPVYQPTRLTGLECTLEHCLPAGEGNFGQELQLLGYEWRTNGENALRPGDELDLWLEWGVVGESSQDWTVFVHLNDPVLGVPIAQRDMYLGQGLWPSTLLRPGERVINHYRVAIPATAVSPAELQLTVGLYNYYSQQRLPLTTGPDYLNLAQLPLETRPGSTPNPVSVNFNQQFELVGYELDPRRVAAGQTVNLTLYWRATAPAGQDFTFFAQVVDPDTTRWASQDVGQPTSSWVVGEVQKITMSLVLNEATPAGVYPLRLGVYQWDEANGFQNLQLVTPDGRLTDDFINLTQIRVESGK